MGNKKRFTLMIAIVALFPAVLSYAATVSLPLTGQTICYDSYGGGHLGAPISCTGTGQDGELLAGVSWPIPRFTNDGSGVITDNLTGLMWTKDAGLPGLQKDWQGALDYIANLNSSGGLAGFTDWHLPNFTELQSLLNLGQADNVPWLESQGFANVSYNYWTSTTQMYETRQYHAWWVDLDDGTTYSSVKGRADHLVWPVRVKTTRAPARPWRTGQTKCHDEDGVQIACAGTGQDGDVLAGAAWPNPRFKDNNDGTITDNLTGLMWLKDGNCLGQNYPNDVPTGRGNWQAALNAVSKINDGNYANCAAGHTDWRLPNRREWQSLLGYSNYSPALPEGHLFTNVLDITPLHFWTSTNSGYLDDAPNFLYAWYVSLYDGMVDNSLKNYNSPRIWPVRGSVSTQQPGAMPGITILLFQD
jgi:hypothetical protein